VAAWACQRKEELCESEDGVGCTMSCRNKCIYDLLKALGWSLVLLLVFSYAFLYLAVAHIILAPFLALPWFLIYLTTFIMSILYMAIDIPQMLFSRRTLTFYDPDMLWGVSLSLLLTLIATFMAIPLGIATLFFSKYVHDILLFYFVPPSGMLGGFIAVLIIRILGG